MFTIRHTVFETNSSSQHVLTVLNKDTFQTLSEYSWDKHVFYAHADGDEYPDPDTKCRKDCTVEILTLEDAYKKYCEHFKGELCPENIDDFEDALDDGKLVFDPFFGRYFNYDFLLHHMILPNKINIDFEYHTSPAE